METQSVMYLQPDWLDQTPTSAGNDAGTVGNWVSPTYPDAYCTYTWPSYIERKVRLTLSEVEHLRKLARADKKLRATLRKFSPHIEVEVDFPGG